MSLRILDPLQLLPFQSGLVDPPLREGAASGASGLDTQQRAITVGETVPIVFCRRVNGVGGVLVSPGATEARYENDGTTNELTVNLMLVLSEGELPTLPYKDVFQRACRVGTWAQTYDRRAGTWTPGNAITVVSGKELWNCPYYCGTSGRYENMTTLSYTNTHDDGDPTWDKQVHVFVRDGMKVTRIIDDTVGPSNNVIDLALYLIRESSRFPEDMLDLDQMEEAANFCDANGFFYNGEFKESTNLEEWLETIGNDFLLRKGDKNGKMGFRPRLPMADDYTISTDPVSFVFTFTENHLLPDGFDISYIPLADRRPICAQVLWREQPDDDLGLIRTAEVRYENEAADVPFEQYDLSAFCASEDHAVKVGAYRVSRRHHITHTLRIRVSPGVYNGTLALGDIVRVRLRRETALDQVTYHDYLYEVERIERTSSGINVLDLMHFPIDSTGASIVAKEVAAATGQGVTFATGRSDFTCDETGRGTDTTPLPDLGIDPTNDNDDEVLIPLADIDDITGTLPSTGDNVFSIADGDEPANGTVSIDADTGDWSYTPDPGFIGDDSFTATITNDLGGITEVPVDVSVSPGVDEITGTLPSIGDEVFSIADGDVPANGIISIDAETGAWSYTPDPNFIGDDSFTATITNDLGGTTQVPVSVSVSPGASDSGVGGAPPYTPPDNPEDPLDEPVDAPGGIEDDRASPTDPLTPGITLTVPDTALPCADGQVCWYRRDKDTGIRTLIKCVPLGSGGSFTLSITTDEIDYIIEAEGECPGSEPFPIDETDTPVIPDTTEFAYVRWTGTLKQYGQPPVEFTSPWLATGSNPSDYWTLQSGAGCALGTPAYIDQWGFPGDWRAVGSAIGPIPWRASVSATKTNDFVVYGFSRMGGLGYNGKGNPCSTSINQPIIGLVEGPAGSTNSISGKWQFSDDQVIVELEWNGDTDSVDPVDVPDT